MTGLDGPFQISQPASDIGGLLWEPSPNARVWGAVSAWVAAGDLLDVNFSFDYLGLGDARSLWRYLAGATDYTVKAVESDTAGYWAVEGRMQKPIYSTLAFLDNWVKWMAGAGDRHGARYFGWTVARHAPR